MTAPKTQRAWAEYRADGTLSEASDLPGGEPVIVVPEAAVKKCKHLSRVATFDAEFCRDCGARRSVRAEGPPREWYSWERPRILRAARGGR